MNSPQIPLDHKISSSLISSHGHYTQTSHPRRVGFKSIRPSAFLTFKVMKANPMFQKPEIIDTYQLMQKYFGRKVIKIRHKADLSRLGEKTKYFKHLKVNVILKEYSGDGARGNLGRRYFGRGLGVGLGGGFGRGPGQGFGGDLRGGPRGGLGTGVGGNFGRIPREGEIIDSAIEYCAPPLEVNTIERYGRPMMLGCPVLLTDDFEDQINIFPGITR